MSSFGINEKELSENLFTLCLQADAMFDQQMYDAVQAAGIDAKVEPASFDHQELLVFYIWLARRVVDEAPKVLNGLQAAYFLVSSNTAFNGQDGKKVFQSLSERFFEYDEAMSNASSKLDVVYVAGMVATRVFAKSPELMVHLPKLEMILSRLMSEWVLSVSKTIKELS